MAQCVGHVKYTCIVSGTMSIEFLVKFYPILMWLKNGFDICQAHFQSFLAPTGAQEMLISVCLSVRSMKTCLELTIFIIWVQILHDDFMMTS